jgi:hypothetical protein
MHVYPCVYLPTTGVSIFKILVRTKICRLFRAANTFDLFYFSLCAKKMHTSCGMTNQWLSLFPSLRIPRCHVGMDDTAYTLSSSSNFGIRHQHLLVFHPTFRVSHVCNFQLPLSSHMNSTIQLVINEVRLLTF